jgi:hypothetical protein
MAPQTAIKSRAVREVLLNDPRSLRQEKFSAKTWLDIGYSSHYGSPADSTVRDNHSDRLLRLSARGLLDLVGDAADGVESEQLPGTSGPLAFPLTFQCIGNETRVNLG